MQVGQRRNDISSKQAKHLNEIRKKTLKITLKLCKRTSPSRFGDMLLFQSWIHYDRCLYLCCSATNINFTLSTQFEFKGSRTCNFFNIEITRATVFSSGCISKASGWARNFSPLLSFKYSHKESAESSPSLMHR